MMNQKRFGILSFFSVQVENHSERGVGGMSLRIHHHEFSLLSFFFIMPAYAHIQQTQQPPDVICQVSLVHPTQLLPIRNLSVLHSFSFFFPIHFETFPLMLHLFCIRKWFLLITTNI